MTNTDPDMELAQQHVKLVRDFFYHLMVYVVVCGLLVVLDVRAGNTSGQPVFGLDWAYWVILFWGLGVMGHGISVYFDDYRVQKVYEQEKRWELHG